jgi:hypothetical protein
MKRHKNKPRKAPYHQPRLIPYGDLRALTRGASFGKGTPDGVIFMGKQKLS